MVEGGLLGRAPQGKEEGTFTLAGLNGTDFLDHPHRPLRQTQPNDGVTPVEIGPAPSVAPNPPVEAAQPAGQPVRPAETQRPAEAARPTEAPPPPEHKATVVDGVLKAQFGDKNLDETLARKDYTRIELQTPANVEVNHFVDQNGYYFWFGKTSVGPDGQKKTETDGQRHYYPFNAQEMCVNDNKRALYLEAQRLQSNEALANKSVAGRQYFENLNLPQATNPVPVAQFASRLAQMPGAVLAVEEKTLKESAQAYPSNPYFKIYLSDIYLAQATKPMLEQMRAGRPMPNDDLQARVKVDLALNLLSDSLVNSRNGLATLHGNKTLPSNISAPMSPYFIFKQNDDASRNAFFSGSFDQATQRTNAQTMIKNMLNTNSWYGQLKKVQPQP